MLEKNKFIFFFVFLIALFAYGKSTQVMAADKINIYLFWAKGCPHCYVEKQFLENLQKRDNQVNIVCLEITESKENRELFTKVGKLLRAEIAGLPFTVVGNLYLVGWQDDQTSGRALEKLLKKVRQESLPDMVGPLMPPPTTCPPEGKRAIPEKITIPLIGEIEIKYLSLGLLTLIFGALDGFNPCAMWVLVFLISLLLGMEDRKKMWALGSIFIFSSGMVYFLFMTAWLNLFIFIGFIIWVRIIIGLLALGAGAYNFKEYFTNRWGTCKITGAERKQRTMDRIKDIVRNQSFWLALGGIIILAFAVNLIELLCSLGLPVIYTEILTLTPIPAWQYYLYLLLYIFIFMLDDMVVFAVAMITLQLVGWTTKYKQWSDLIGGLIMLIIGVLLIFKPEMLMFG